MRYTLKVYTEARDSMSRRLWLMTSTWRYFCRYDIRSYGARDTSK